MRTAYSSACRSMARVAGRWVSHWRGPPDERVNESDGEGRGVKVSRCRGRGGCLPLDSSTPGHLGTFPHPPQQETRAWQTTSPVPMVRFRRGRPTL